jgi:hypothetical protein
MSTVGTAIPAAELRFLAEMIAKLLKLSFETIFIEIGQPAKLIF